MTSLGDLDGDGITDLAAGASYDSTGGDRRGAVHIMLLNRDGTVKSSRKIANETNGGPTLADVDWFGRSLSSIGDIDGDGVRDLTVGAPGDDTGGSFPATVGRGAAYVLLLNADGTAKSSHKIDSSTSELTLRDGDLFGDSVAPYDVNGDGVTDLLVGAQGDDTAGNFFGAVHLLAMREAENPLPTVTLSSDRSAILEANGVATLTATLSAAHTQPITVDLSFSGSATMATDYTVPSAQISIPAGSLSGSIAITAVQDAIDEDHHQHR